jgi:hypothetical protein
VVTSRTAGPAGAGDWRGLASDSTGRYLVTGIWNGSIYTSSNYGLTWTPVLPSGLSSGNWLGFASSSNGQYLLTGNRNSSIYTSQDYGSNWAPRTNGVPSGEWRGFASDSTGRYLVIGNANYGSIYTSTDYGSNWTARTNGAPSSGQWCGFASDSTGQFLVTGTLSYGSIYTSTDYGSNWTARSNGAPSSGRWLGFASDSTGRYLVATDINDPNYKIYTSKDYGSNWSTNNNSAVGVWLSIASDSTGKYLVAGSNGGTYSYIYTSKDYGSNWASNTNGLSTVSWDGLASDSTGRFLIAANQNGFIYTTTDYGSNWRASASNSRPLPPYVTGVSGITTTGFTVTWDGATGATSYVYAISPVAGSSNATLGSLGSGSITWTGLSSGVSYQVTITSSNAFSNAARTVTQVVPGPPGAPTAVGGAPGNTTVAVYWTAPVSNGGSAITNYRITVSPGGSNVDAGTATSGTVTGLTNGSSYTFTVTASNAYGISPASTASSAVVPAAGSLNGLATSSWISLSSSYNGQYLIAGNDNNSMYRSSDYGNTWTLNSVNLAYSTSDSTGRYLTGIYSSWGYSYIYTSTDYGLSWNPQYFLNAMGGVSEVSSDSTGRYIIVTINTAIYRSEDYGSNWIITQTHPTYGWVTAKYSGIGEYAAVSGGDHYLYISKNYGSNFTQNYTVREPTMYRQGISSIAFDSTGRYIITGTNTSYPPANGIIWRSTDYGSNWSSNIIRSDCYGATFSSFASDSTGMYLAMIYAVGYIGPNVTENPSGTYTSTNGGVSWVKVNSQVTIGKIVSDSTGRYLVEYGTNSFIYTSTDYGSNWRASSSNSRPLPPYITGVSSITTTGFTVRWDGATGATSYVYAISPSAGSSNVTLSGLSAGSIAWTGLSSGVSYQVTITSSNAFGSNARTVTQGTS